MTRDMYNNVMYFIETDYTQRTDTSFQNKEQPEHHVDSSSLLNLPNFDMINNVPVAHTAQRDCKYIAE